jgi:hypothetical protein
MSEIPIGHDLTEELGLPGELGGAAVEEGGFYAESHDQPIGIRLRDIFTGVNDALDAAVINASPKLSELYRRFELWIIPHGVSILRRSGSAEPISVGIEVRYKNENRTCSVRSLIPSPKFVEHGRIHGSISLSGELDSPVSSGTASSIVKNVLGIGFGFHASGGASLCFDAAVVTPYLSAVGVNSSRCEWLFDKHTDALFGRDIRTQV